MKVVELEVEIETRGELDIVDITRKVEKTVSETGIKNGIVNIFIPGSTGAVTTMEYEHGLLKDLPSTLERVAPRNASYEHEKTWHDGNGHSRVRTSIIGPSITIPIRNDALRLSTWRQVVFLELDTRLRNRRIIVTCLGE